MDDSQLERLKQLAELRDSGVLTDEEFAEQKAKVLADPPPARGVEASPARAAKDAAIYALLVMVFFPLVPLYAIRRGHLKSGVGYGLAMALLPIYALLAASYLGAFDGTGSGSGASAAQPVHSVSAKGFAIEVTNVDDHADGKWTCCSDSDPVKASHGGKLVTVEFKITNESNSSPTYDSGIEVQENLPKGGGTNLTDGKGRKYIFDSDLDGLGPVPYDEDVWNEYLDGMTESVGQGLSSKYAAAFEVPKDAQGPWTIRLSFNPRSNAYKDFNNGVDLEFTYK